MRRIRSEKGKLENRLKDRERKANMRRKQCEGNKVRGRSYEKTRKFSKKYPMTLTKYIILFKNKIVLSPEYVCTFCCRCLYRDSVVKFKAQSEFVVMLNTYIKSNLYVCCTCKRYIKTNRMPPTSTIKFNVIT
jgi:hypothetical protein